MRCFLALPLPATICRRVIAVQETLRAACQDADVRWARPETSHLTLQFLGNVDRARILDLVPALAAEAATHRIAELALHGVGAFPSPRRARVLWIGVTTGAPAVTHLAAALRRVTEPLGIPSESRPFTPHVTLGRVRAPERGANLTEAIAACDPSEVGAWRPDAVVLFESRLHPKGAVHEPLATLPLQ
jgi:2'-5' RNA ligase